MQSFFVNTTDQNQIKLALQIIINRQKNQISEWNDLYNLLSIAATHLSMDKKLDAPETKKFISSVSDLETSKKFLTELNDYLLKIEVLTKTNKLIEPEITKEQEKILKMKAVKKLKTLMRTGSGTDLIELTLEKMNVAIMQELAEMLNMKTAIEPIIAPTAATLTIANAH